MRKTAALATFLLFATASPGAEEAESPNLHAPFDALLKETVKDGLVDYKALEKREEALDAYLSSLADYDAASRPRAERLAFWINAYNAFALKLVLEHYPGIDSVNDVEKPWDTKLAKAAGKLRSLNEIEHEILRKEFEDPRIHFAIVCASISCPDLRSRAYVAEKLDEQLDAAATRFLADPDKGFRVAEKDEEEVVVEVSKIFEWFAEDFVIHSGSIYQYILKYVPPEDAALLKSRRRDVRVRFMDYDWGLNGK
ncbi:MAG: DUF547 domain-containing protein [Candidatus Latescibacteria bacterium]|nr:DUF547 domain-containing protein [Candidatus Latescibacterota bacterium]